MVQWAIRTTHILDHMFFNHGVWMGGQAGGDLWEKVCQGRISETVRCRKLILSRDIS